jgi:hypothetical protein
LYIFYFILISVVIGWCCYIIVQNFNILQLIMIYILSLMIIEKPRTPINFPITIIVSIDCIYLYFLIFWPIHGFIWYIVWIFRYFLGDWFGKLSIIYFIDIRNRYLYLLLRLLILWQCFVWILFILLYWLWVLLWFCYLYFNILVLIPTIFLKILCSMDAVLHPLKFPINSTILTSNNWSILYTFLYFIFITLLKHPLFWYYLIYASWW